MARKAPDWLIEMTSGEFKEILLPCYRRMYSVAFAILRNSDDASDAVQDAMSSLWQKRHGMKAPDNPEAFCAKVVRNACIDRLRSQPTLCLETVDAVLNASSGESADDSATLASSKAFVRQALQSFSEKHRRVLALSFISQLTYDEISEATGESPPNVRQIISRGRMKLREYFKNA